MAVQPWQQKFFDTMTKSNVAIITGRRTGKSSLSAQALKRLMDDINSRPITDMLLDEGRVYGARYYTAEPVGGNWREMEDWVIANMGSSTGSIWSQEVDKTTPIDNERWYANNRKFWFRSEADRTMFVLKWR